ncbi:uncharacterized protein [Macrobrachium rosenbergii]|uniref:uncharacterized protein n=1 Tax=Macrobrachium rosenbergii TaxID=79674 RepID=UPI0034D5F766
MTDKFAWHGINKDVRQGELHPVPDEQNILAHTQSVIGDFPQPRREFGHIHIKVVGPLPQSGGARYLLTIIDCSTHWSKATPMDEASTTSCAEALLSTNGMVKRARRSLKAALMARCTDERWKEQLPWVLLGLHTAPKVNGNASPAEKVHGETLAVLREFFPHRTFTDRTITYSPTALHSCAYVFVRVDARQPPLTRPYKGLH